MKKFTIEDVKDHSLVVDINEVCFNSWNPKIKRSKEYAKVLDSVRMNGLSMPIIVREVQDRDFKYEVLDGEQRLTACLDLGYDKIWIVNMGEVSDTDAKAKTVWMEMAVPFDQEQLGKLLVELVDKVELPYTKEEIQLFDGIDLSDDVNEDDFQDEYDDTLKTFSIHVTQENKDSFKEFFKQKQEEMMISENTLMKMLIENFKIGNNIQNIEAFIEEEKSKE